MTTEETQRPTTEEQVRAWLLDYAWAHPTPEAKAAEVDCIMAQDDWRWLEARADHYAGMHESGGGPEAFDAAHGFALSALYECHTEPHQPTCPFAKAKGAGDG
jgi:hypothetical protein